MIRISTTAYPKKEVIATCGECGKEVARETFDTYFDHARVCAKVRKNYKSCPYCEGGESCRSVGMTGAEKVQWEKHVDVYGRVTKDWEAKLSDGDFLVWKHGKIWRGRWRAYGSDEPVMLGFASTLEGMKRRCEKSAYWKETE